MKIFNFIKRASSKPNSALKFFFMLFWESSQLLVSYLLCQTALKDFSIAKQIDKKTEIYINKYCLPLLNTSAGSYVLEQLLELVYNRLDPKLVRELFNFVKKHKDKIPQRLYYEMLTINSFLNNQPNKFVEYGTKAIKSGSRNLKLILYLAFVAEYLQKPQTFYLAVSRLHQLGKPVEPLIDRFFYNQPFPLNKETLKVAKEFLQLRPKEGYFIGYSLMLENLGRFQEEEQILKEALKKFPDDHSVRKSIIRFYVKIGKPKEALKFVASPDLEKFYYSQLLDTAKDFSTFRKVAKEILKRYHNDNSLLLKILTGYIAYDYLEGLNSLQRLILTQRTINEVTAELLGTILTAKFTLTGKWKDSEKRLINRLYSEYPYKEHLKLLKLLLDISEGKLKEARTLLKEINQQIVTPYTATIYNALLTYLGSKSLKDTFPKKEPLLADTYLKTLYWLDKNFYLNSVKALQKETENGDECLAYTSPSWTFGDLNLTLDLSKVCLHRFGNNSNVLNSVGYIMLLVDPARYLKEAKNLIKKAIKVTPQNVDAYDSLGWVYYYEGNLKEALKWVEKTLKKVPDSLVVNYHMAEILYLLNRPCKALEYLERAFKEKKQLSREPEPGIYLKMENLKEKLLKECRR